eukprot:2046096-Pleurochrysis_carterae.AAC.1
MSVARSRGRSRWSLGREVNALERDRVGDGSRKLDGVGCTELRVIRPATAFAIIKFKSGG